MPRRLLLLGVLATLALLGPASVLAHAALASASPGPGDVITDVPDALVGQFTQDLDPRIGRSFMEVRDATGTSIAKGGVDDSASDERTMRVPLPDLAPGVYEVRWQTLSTEDDELERGTYTFTVLAPSPTPPPTPTTGPTAPAGPTTSAVPTETPAAASPSPSAGPAPDPAGTDAGQVLVPIVVGLALVAGIALWLSRRRTAA